MTETRVPKPKVGSPIIFRAQKDGPERVVRPCSGQHREYWLSSYLVVSCSKCMATVELLDPPAVPVTAEDERTDRG